jgi:hypothetical protein
MARKHSMATVTAAAKHPAFNSDFYAAVSAIIPVLFLALVVESRSYHSLLQASVDLQRWGKQHGRAATILVTYPAVLLQTLALLIVVSGAAGECAAVYALYQHQTSQTTETLVLVATWFLVAVIAAARSWHTCKPSSPGWYPARRIGSKYPRRSTEQFQRRAFLAFRHAHGRCRA